MNNGPDPNQSPNYLFLKRVPVNLQKNSVFSFLLLLLKNENSIFEIRTPAEFNSLALEVFLHQSRENKVYSEWINNLGTDPSAVKSVSEIPFLPVEFFKTQKIITGEIPPNARQFLSSTTTSGIPSVHIVKDLGWYRSSLLRCFRHFYGSPSQYCILALVPDSRTKESSSLAWMCEQLIDESGNPLSGFCADAREAAQRIQGLKNNDQKVMIIGLTYALLDLADIGVELNGRFIVIETGGMKGKRKEMLKSELHEYLAKKFDLRVIHSEYGMTEMLSQGYSRGDGLFEFPPWVRVLLRETDDPNSIITTENKTGGLCIIDLANKDSCSFLAVKDLGRMRNGKLELLGRYDHSDIRGCNLMFS
jgi:hypothetical protein